MSRGELECVVLIRFNGGIRKGNTPEICSRRWCTPMTEESVVFIDDSYYQGRTILAIRDYMLRYDTIINDVVVAYNGSNDTSIKALYHYH